MIVTISAYWITVIYVIILCVMYVNLWITLELGIVINPILLMK